MNPTNNPLTIKEEAPSVTVEDAPIEFNADDYITDLNKRMQTELEELDKHTIVYVCPKHPTFLLGYNEIETRYSPWEYYKCPNKDCFVCCGVNQVEDYQAKFDKQVADFWLRNLEQRHKCFCKNTLILKISKSEKNPGRMFFGCRKKKCNFFYWADKNPSERMEKWIREEADKPKPQRKVKKPEEEVCLEEKKPGWKGKQLLKEYKTDIDMRTADIKDPQAAAYWKKVRMMNDESTVEG